MSVRRGVDHSRPCVVTWSDAAGASRWVAAVVHVGGQFWWTRCQTSDAIWNQLLDRGDHQIGFQELLGILLVWGTFQHLLRESLWLAFVDNDGVLHALTRGGGGGPESFACIGRLWLELAYNQTDLHCARVQSAANIADGPTREMFEFIGLLKASWVPPKLPLWVEQLWLGPDIPRELMQWCSKSFFFLSLPVGGVGVCRSAVRWSDVRFFFFPFFPFVSVSPVFLVVFFFGCLLRRGWGDWWGFFFFPFLNRCLGPLWIVACDLSGVASLFYFWIVVTDGLATGAIVELPKNGRSAYILQALFLAAWTLHHGRPQSFVLHA